MNIKQLGYAPGATVVNEWKEACESPQKNNVHLKLTLVKKAKKRFTYMVQIGVALHARKFQSSRKLLSMSQEV